MDNIRKHFEEEAREFDDLIVKLIPHYHQMIEALIDAIPFDGNASFKVIDLGCGTGTISLAIANKFPHADITCLDIAASMIELAKHKLSSHPNKSFIVSDFSKISFEQSYDVVVSSLALHHLETDTDKINFYRKIYAALKPSGVFYNADVVLASSAHLQNTYMARWKEYMQESVSKDEIEHKWIPTYEAEDRPAVMLDQLHWLQSIGFKDVDVLWKYYNFAVYGGVK